MDTSSIPINLSAIYDILLVCLYFLASVWGISKTIQYFRR